MLTCPSCGRENPIGFRFCGACGVAIGTKIGKPREERRVLTVLFADLVGFTERADRLDPEEVGTFLHGYHERLRSELERHGGTVEKFIGDAVVALFGAPVAHEDDPERAVRAALAIRDAMSSDADGLRVRIGVNSGEVLVRLDARVNAGEGMAAGDVVNTAARLQTAAPVNGVLVGESTYRATAVAIEYRPTAPLALKGKSALVPAWEAMRRRSPAEFATRESSATPFVGRAGDLRRVLAALASARDLASPQMVTVVGDPGIGKSRLVVEVAAAVERDGEPVTWRRGRSLAYGESVSFLALGEMVKSQAEIFENDPADQAEAKLSGAVAALVSDDRDRQWLLRYLRPLVGLSGDAEAAERPGEMFAAWRRFLEEVAAMQPLGLVFEDIHWAHDGLLDFIGELADLGHGRLLILCTARPELLQRRPAWGKDTRDRTTLTLERLDDEHALRLLSALLDPATLDPLRGSLIERAGGNPFYAEQCARMLLERRSMDEQALPDSVQAIIGARLDALAPSEKGLLQSAAVIGSVFWQGAVSAVGEIDADVVEDQLARLEVMDLIRRDRQSTVEGEAQFTFQHVLVRDVAYAQVTRVRRAEKHRRAAEWLHGLAPDRAGDRAETLGRHYLNALRFARLAKQETSEFADAARNALREAGTRAWWLGSYAAAADFCRVALELTVNDAPDRPELLFQFGRALFWAEEAGLDEMTAAVDAIEAQGDAESAAVAASWASKAFWMHGDRDAAYRQIERALALVSSVPDSPAAAEALTRWAGYDMFAGRYSEAILRSREALPLVGRLGLDLLRGRLLNIIGTSRVFDGDPGGVEDLEKSLDLANASNSAEQIHSAYENLFSAQMQTGRLQKAAATFAALSLSVARRGAAHERRWLKVDGVRQGFATGDWDSAVRLADEFLAEVDAGSPHYLEAPSRAIRSAIALARGDLEAAISDSEKALAAGRQAQDIQVLAPALWAGASVLFAQADPRQARDLASELIRGAPSGIWNLLEWGCVSNFAWLAVDLGLGADMLEIVADVPQSPWARAVESIVAGRLPEAVSLLAEIGDVPGEARTRLRLAAALARNGRRHDARTMSRPAMDFYRRVGARTSAKEAETLTTGAA